MFPQGLLARSGSLTPVTTVDRSEESELPPRLLLHEPGIDLRLGILECRGVQLVRPLRLPDRQSVEAAGGADYELQPQLQPLPFASYVVLRVSSLKEFLVELEFVLTDRKQTVVAFSLREALNLVLRAYPGWARASRAVWAFLNAIRPLASWSRARWFSSFFDQRIRSARLRFSHEWQASTTQRRARQPGVRSLRLISSPRVRMCGVNPRPATSSRTLS